VVVKSVSFIVGRIRRPISWVIFRVIVSEPTSSPVIFIKPVTVSNTQMKPVLHELVRLP
jgi:hypothetical protein